ncbi:MAG: transglutaminase family protein [Opitutaceae bacterium]|nr:transglutaminase family protein [Opitutaceae bacterium]
MHLRVTHRTTFTYEGQAHDSFNEVRLRPIDDETQRCHSFKLGLAPAASTRDYVDFYGNTVHYFEVPGEHRKLVIEAVSHVETTPLSARPAIPRVAIADLERSAEREMLAEFYGSSHYVPLEVDLWREAQDALAEGRSDVWGDVRRLGEHIYRRFAYRPKSTGVNTRATDVLKLRMGVCQDFAHVHLGLCRSMGIPARYVSGYFFNTTRRPREIEASHAWIEAYVPGHGWAAYDPTHERVADERYVKIAVGRDYADIRPVNGTYRGPPTRSLKVVVSVRETPAPLAVVAT